jgi:LysM repeat protein
MLILHVFIIGGIILSDSSSSRKAPPQSPAAQSLLTKSKNEIGGASAKSVVLSDGEGHETYAVRSGDSLPMIVARFGVDRDELVALNKLDQNVEFSAGTMLKIPNHKVAAPLQISAARPLPAMGIVPPTTTTINKADSNEQDVGAASTSDSSNGSEFASLSDKMVNGAGLVPLPEIHTDEAVKTDKQEVTPADAPPAAISKPVVSKTDAVTPEKPVKKAVAVAPPPHPVPTPKEMMKRPITKADDPPKTPSKPSTTSKPSASSGGTHTLVKGETLYRLSSQLGVSVESLMKANNIKDPAKLRDGMKLVIPAK